MQWLTVVEFDVVQEKYMVQDCTGFELNAQAEEEHMCVHSLLDGCVEMCSSACWMRMRMCMCMLVSVRVNGQARGQLCTLRIR